MNEQSPYNVSQQEPLSLSKISEEIFFIEHEADLRIEENGNVQNEQFWQRLYYKRWIILILSLLLGGAGVILSFYLGNLIQQQTEELFFKTAQVETEQLTKYSNNIVQNLAQRAGIVGMIAKFSPDKEGFRAQTRELFTTDYHHDELETAYLIPDWPSGRLPSPEISMRDAVALDDRASSKEALEDFALANLWPLVARARTAAGGMIASPLYLNYKNEVKTAFLKFVDDGFQPGVMVVIINANRLFDQFVATHAPEGLSLRLGFSETTLGLGISPRGIPQEGTYILNQDPPDNLLTSFVYNKEFYGAFWIFNWDVTTSYQQGVIDSFSLPVKLFGSILSILIAGVLIYSQFPNRRTRALVAEEVADLKLAILKVKRMIESRGFLVLNGHQEMRSSLEVLLGFSKMIQKEIVYVKTESKLERYISGMLQSVNTLHEQTQKIMSLISFEADDKRNFTETTNIGQMLETLHTALFDGLEESEITLSIEIASEVPDLVCDRQMFTRILQNLLSSALKFTPPEGHISIKVFLDNTITFQEEVNQYDTKLRIEISDDGYGLLIERAVTDPESNKLLQWTNADPVGTIHEPMINLSISLCQLMGIDLMISARPGAGTLVQMILPEELLERESLEACREQIMIEEPNQFRKSHEDEAEEDVIIEPETLEKV